MKKYIIVVDKRQVKSKEFQSVEVLRGLSKDGLEPASHYWAEWQIGITKEFIELFEESKEEHWKGTGIIKGLSEGHWFDAEVWTAQAILDKLELKEIK